MEKQKRTKVGIKDVSEDAGVALSTVSHVLNGTAPISDEVRNRVLESARRLGYLAKRQQKGAIASLTTVYLAVPPGNLPHNDLNLVSWTLLTSLTQECKKRNVKLIPHGTGEELSAPDIIAGAKAAGANGIILVYDDRPKLLRALANSGIPVVLLNGEDPSMAVDTVIPANRYAGRLATDWLLERGHRRILHLTWRGRSTIKRRLNGFFDAYAERGLPETLGEVLYADSFEPAEAQKALKRFLAEKGGMDGCTAIFCASDNLAMGALSALKEAGLKIPDDVALVGFDGVALGDLTHPPLTTISVPLSELAALAVQTLENRLSILGMQHPPCRIELGCHLIERGSGGDNITPREQ